jgi:hypothetical protein
MEEKDKDDLSPEQARDLLKEAQKEERAAKDKTKFMLRKYNQVRYDTGTEPRASASINETSEVLENMAKDTSLSNVVHLTSVVEGKGRPDNWVDEALDNRPYNLNEAHKRASKNSTGIRRAKVNGKLKGSSIRGITSSSSLKAALNEYRKELTESERIDNIEEMLIQVKLENDILKAGQMEIMSSLSNTEKLVMEVTKDDTVKGKCILLLSQGLSAYKVHQQYKGSISYASVKRLKSNFEPN